MSERLPEKIERENFSTAVRRAAWARCGGRCEGCGKVLVKGGHTYDHTIPFRISRDSSLGNCKVLCSDGKDSCDWIKTYGQDLPGIAARKRYGKNRLPLDIDRPAKKPSTIRTRGFQKGGQAQKIPSRGFQQRPK